MIEVIDNKITAINTIDEQKQFRDDLTKIKHQVKIFTDTIQQPYKYYNTLINKQLEHFITKYIINTNNDIKTLIQKNDELTHEIKSINGACEERINMWKKLITASEKRKNSNNKTKTKTKKNTAAATSSNTENDLDLLPVIPEGVPEGVELTETKLELIAHIGRSGIKGLGNLLHLRGAKSTSTSTNTRLNQSLLTNELKAELGASKNAALARRTNNMAAAKKELNERTAAKTSLLKAQLVDKRESHQKARS